VSGCPRWALEAGWDGGGRPAIPARLWEVTSATTATLPVDTEGYAVPAAFREHTRDYVFVFRLNSQL